MKKKKTILKTVACILVLSLSLTVLQPLAVFAEQNINSAETTLEKWVPSEEDMRLPDTTGDLTLEQLETAKLSAEDIPEYISQQDIEEKGHVNRLRAQEPDDNTIVFQNRDGTKTAYFFSNPVKYTDNNGNIKDKHSKLDSENIPAKYSEKYGYVNQQNDIKTYFPKQMAANQGMLLESEDVSVELIPIEATEKKYVLQNGSIVTPGEYISKNQTVSTKTLNNISTSNSITKIQTEKLTAQKANANKVHITDELTSITKDTVQYNGVFGSKTTLRYSSTFEGLKEDIVLSENTGVNNFRFRFKTNGLSLVCGEDKQYYLADPLSGEYLVAIGELIVYDSNNRIYKNDEGEEYNHYYEVTTVKTDQEYILTVVVDEEFLNSSDTLYPVYIDPTMTVMPKGSVRDAAIYSSGYAFANDEKIVKVGCSGSYGIGRGLYNFPILNFNTDFILMYGNQISSAKLYLYAQPYSTGNTSSFDNSKTLSMYEFYSSWSPSTVKWNNTSPYNYGTYISSANVTSGWTTFDISYIVDKFKTDSDYTTDFKGVIIKANIENTSTWKKFVSSLHPTLSDRRPYIQITYNDSPTACSQVVSGATYYLKNYNGDYLDVYDSGTADNTQLLTYTFNGNANQQFKITNVYGGEYEIAPQHTTGKVLSVNSNGQVIIESDCNIDSQRWYIFYRNGNYHIVNKAYNSGVMAPTYSTDYVSINNEYDYCCWEIQGITVSGNWVPTSTVAKLADALGFLYDPNQDITYSKINAWQRNVGYCWTYDMSAILISSYIDSERFYFNYNGKEYMIEIWKGQYGIQTGAEIGVYYRNVGERDWKDSLAGSGDPGVSSRWYQCADNNNLLEMSFVLKKGNSIILQRGFEEHWWLTGFKWGMFTENPNDLSMSISLIFADEGMKNAFVGSGNSRNLRGRGYSYSSEVKDGKYTISFDFKIPKSPQPSTMHNYASGIQNNNEVLVNAYNVVMTTLNIENNDLNSINESAILSSSNQALKNAYLTIKEYMNTEMATMERYNLN